MQHIFLTTIVCCHMDINAAFEYAFIKATYNIFPYIPCHLDVNFTSRHAFIKATRIYLTILLFECKCKKEQDITVYVYKTNCDFQVSKRERLYINKTKVRCYDTLLWYHLTWLSFAFCVELQEKTGKSANRESMRVFLVEAFCFLSKTKQGTDLVLGADLEVQHSNMEVIWRCFNDFAVRLDQRKTTAQGSNSTCTKNFVQWSNNLNVKNATTTTIALLFWGSSTVRENKSFIRPRR